MLACYDKRACYKYATTSNYTNSWVTRLKPFSFPSAHIAPSLAIPSQSLCTVQHRTSTSSMP